MTDTEVAIIGGGPVGLGLAIDLALRGVTTRVLERSTELHTIPKGQNLTQRTGEHFRAWGITDAIRAATPIPREYGNAGIVTYGHLLSDYHYDWFQRAKVGAYYHALNERLPQYETERVLRARAAEFDNIRVDYGCKVTGLKQDDARVWVEFEQGNETRQITARYAIGCDGARSVTRELAGIEQAADHDGPRMALLVFRSMELDKLLERYPGKSIYNVMRPGFDGYWQFLGRVDLEGGWFCHFPVPADATADKDYFTARMHEAAGQPFALEFQHIGFWDLRISHARTYRAGRVFIAGDAAHSHPPYGGYGINTGFEDARNLSWKLAATLQGWGGEALLDSYNAERHPVFKSVSQDFIERMITDFREFLESHAPDTDRAAFEAAWNARANADDSDVTEFLPHYAGSPIAFGKPGAVSGAKGIHCFTARPGHHLAPQPMPDGDLWDALGPGFTLIDLTDDQSLSKPFSNAADDVGIALRTVALPDAAAREAYGTDAILVRPDQFIAWTNGMTQPDPSVILRHAVGAK